MMVVDEIIKDAKQKMEKAIEVLSSELRGLRTGIASPGLVEGVKVECYGTPTPLKQVASISTPEPRLILIKPFDPTIVSAIEKALLKYDIGATPQVEGKIIRLPIPPLSEEGRKKMTNIARERAEVARTAIRNIRRDANKEIDDKEKQKLISEDDKFRAKNETQKSTDEYDRKIKEILEKKQGEIMRI
jgi:ribosome recycling factor